MRRFLLLLAVFTAFTLVAAACGNDDDGNTDSTTSSSSSSIAIGGEGEDAEDGEDSDEAADSGASDDEAEDSEGDDEGAAGDFTTHKVPDDYATIQDAVDAAVEGDLVLIGPGTYHEAVIVQTDNIVIRGTDRNEVILDGEHEEGFENGIIVFSNGVAVENLTAHSYKSNGVFFTGGEYDGDGSFLQDWRASYVTTYNNGLYGVYGFNAQGGLIEHSYGSGHPDSAFYIGQCFPCNSVIDNVLAEHNALGYSGTNAGGDLYVINSEWRQNRVGVVPNSLNSEALAPQHEAVFAGNYVHDNGNEVTPRRGEDWDLAFGVGLVIAGGNDNLVTKNLVENNLTAGIAVSIFPDGDTIWTIEGNEVRENTATGNTPDLLLIMADGSEGPLGNCFEGNTFTATDPADIETVAACDVTEAFTPGAIPELVNRPTTPYEDIVTPGPQESMPDAETAPPVPATTPEFPDVDAITVPESS